MNEKNSEEKGKEKETLGAGEGNITFGYLRKGRGEHLPIYNISPRQGSRETFEGLLAAQTPLVMCNILGLFKVR